MRNEILFFYLNSRRHARIVEKKPEYITDKRYIGKIDGYSIYSTSTLIDQFSFIAVRE